MCALLGTVRHTSTFRHDLSMCMLVSGHFWSGYCFIIMMMIFAVFVEIFETSLRYNKEGKLRCTVKAPTNSIISVWHNRNLLTKPFNADKYSKNCNSQPQIYTSAQQLDNKFSLFSIEIHVHFQRYYLIVALHILFFADRFAVFWLQILELMSAKWNTSFLWLLKSSIQVCQQKWQLCKVMVRIFTV